MLNPPRLSDRNNYGAQDAEIKIREDAPPRFRSILIQLAEEQGLHPSTLRSIICQILRQPPDPSNWSEYPNIDNEVNNLILSCDWYHVYDIAEEIFLSLRELGKAGAFQDELNKFFRSTGIGWQMIAGAIETRGTEAFESAVHGAAEALEENKRPTAANEIQEAREDLSRRPTPDLTGSVQHSMAALECVARDVVGNPKATLGDIIKKYPTLLPKPLDDAITKAWGYASEMARHVREGRTPTRQEAELVVGLAATVATFLSRKAST